MILFPDPKGFDDWREWAQALIQVLEAEDRAGQIRMELVQGLQEALDAKVDI